MLLHLECGHGLWECCQVHKGIKHQRCKHLTPRHMGLLPLVLCRKEDCPKNHIEHFEVVDGETITKGAKLHLVHHKNEKRDGTLVLSVTPGLVDTLEMMEKASKFLAPNCPTLLFLTGLKTPFTDSYFSTVCTGALSWDGHKCTATDMRHEFSTLWRDFEDSQLGSSSQQQQLEVAAATHMGNRPASWDVAYDDKADSRAMERMLAKYPAFVAWVKAQHASKRQHRARDPTADA